MEERSSLWELPSLHHHLLMQPYRIVGTFGPFLSHSVPSIHPPDCQRRLVCPGWGLPNYRRVNASHTMQKEPPDIPTLARGYGHGWMGAGPQNGPIYVISFPQQRPSGASPRRLRCCSATPSLPSYQILWVLSRYFGANSS